MRAKKSYGQHFLIDEQIARRIISEIGPLGDQLPVLEVGPGKGVLTKYLLESKSDFKSVEADPDMYEYLIENYPEIQDRLILKDFLKTDPQTIFPDQQFILFGNFPYNISSQILIKMLTNKKQIPLLIGMFQKELADRVVSKEGSKVYGRISVMVQAFYEGETLFNVDPGSFSPPPKVNSSVIALRRKENLELDCDEKLFRQLVNLGFSQRRKMLRNTLKSLINDNDFLKQDVFTRRPEQLSVKEFIDLTNTITKFKQNES